MSGGQLSSILQESKKEFKNSGPNAAFSESVRLKIVELVKAGHRPTEIAREFGCDTAKILLWSRIDLMNVKLNRQSRKLAEYFPRLACH